MMNQKWMDLCVHYFKALAVSCFLFLFTYESVNAQSLNQLNSLRQAAPAAVVSSLPSSPVQATSEKVSAGLPSQGEIEKMRAKGDKVSLSELTQAHKNELKALDRQHQSDLKNLKASQKTRLSEWETREKEARHLFFKEHQNGPERRTYIQEFLKRREDLNHQLASEKDELKKSFEQKVSTLKKTHSEDLSRAKSEVKSESK